MGIKNLSIERVWNNYIGNIWYNLFVFFNLSKEGILVEIAPGEVNKIGLGLSKYNFSGTIYLVDICKNSLKKVVRKYKYSMPHAKIIPLCIPFGECFNYLPSKIDMLVSNHPLDDLIIGKSMSKKKINNFFSNHSNLLVSKTKKLWLDFESSKLNSLKIKRSVFDDWKNIIKKINPSFVIISQYESYFFKKNNLLSPDKHAFDILKKLRKFYYDKEVCMKGKIENLIEYKRWLVLKMFK
ncbi:hypothetical protein GW932_03090 [archaeon]|nr:hypothetical protein [archaeon]